MKALYIIWPDFDYIDKCIEAGIDTLIIANQNLTPEEDQQHIQWGSYQDTIQILDKYHKTKIKLLLCPVWVPHWKDLLISRAYVENNKVYSRTPCPLSPSFIQERVSQAKVLVNQYNCDLIWDPENYASKEGGLSYPGRFSLIPERKCECPRCKLFKYNSSKQWIEHAKMCKIAIGNDIKIQGQLQSFNPYSFKKYQGEKWFFTEQTYPQPNKKVSKWNLTKVIIETYYQNLVNKIIFKNNVKICAGLWIERYTASEFLKQIELINKIPIFDGYWIYSQIRLSKNSYFWNHLDYQPTTPYYKTLIDSNQSVSDPYFFEKLKMINNKKNSNWIYQEKV